MKEPFLAGHYYHVFHHAVGDLNLFRDNRDYQTFLIKYQKFLGEYLRTFAYCLMPNHFHMLVRVQPAQKDADRILQKWSDFLNSYAQGYNRKHQRWGRVFQQGLPRTLIPHEEALIAVLHYIHYNPVKHGFNPNPWDWRYSSLSALVQSAPTRLAREEVLEWFGGPAAFRQLTDAYELPPTRQLKPKWFLED